MSVALQCLSMIVLQALLDSTPRELPFDTRTFIFRWEILYKKTGGIWRSEIADMGSKST